MYKVKIESVTKNSIDIFENTSFVVCQNIAEINFKKLKLLQKENYLKTIACIRIYKDEELIEQYGSI